MTIRSYFTMIMLLVFALLVIAIGEATTAKAACPALDRFETSGCVAPGPNGGQEPSVGAATPGGGGNAGSGAGGSGGSSGPSGDAGGK